MENKLLLTGVFGPFGVKTKYADGTGMQMELLNNQITRQQSIHSPRQFYFTHALYLLAENIKTPSTVLDFPKWKDFIYELKTGNYTHVGINFIVPNVLKAKRMACYIRKHYPHIKIILGGYGTIIPDLDMIVPHDDKCVGEGVFWIRKYFGEDVKELVKHPVLQNPIMQKLYGYKTIPRSSVVLPGLGCMNGCEFCVTSHVFNKSYTPILNSGKAIFKACLASEKELKATCFTIMDENFLKTPERAVALLKEMETYNKNYVFEIFSSAEAITELGVDFLVRLGVKTVWIGVESKAWAHEKTKGIDLKKLIHKLQENGIAVNSSAILFLDHHDEKTMKEDIDWVIDLGADLTQFMNYTPFPTTALYSRLEKAGRLKCTDDVPYTKYHGATELNWVHPHINSPEKQYHYTKNAFKRKYHESGPGLLNMARTAIMGYESLLKKMAYNKRNALVWNNDSLSYENCDQFHDDRFLELRVKKAERIAMNAKPVLLPLTLFSPNTKIRKKAIETISLYNSILGKFTNTDKLKSSILLGFAIVEALRLKFNTVFGRETIVRQPPVIKTSYRL